MVYSVAELFGERSKAAVEEKLKHDLKYRDVMQEAKEGLANFYFKYPELVSKREKSKKPRVRLFEAALAIVIASDPVKRARVLRGSVLDLVFPSEIWARAILRLILEADNAVFASREIEETTKRAVLLLVSDFCIDLKARINIKQHREFPDLNLYLVRQLDMSSKRPASNELTSERNKRVDQHGGSISGMSQPLDAETHSTSHSSKCALLKDDLEELEERITALESKKSKETIALGLSKVNLSSTKTEIDAKEAELQKLRAKHKDDEEKSSRIDSTILNIDKDLERAKYSMTVKQDMLRDYEKRV